MSGTTTTAPQFNGLLNASLTTWTAASGTTLSETVFNDIVCLTYSYNARVREVIHESLNVSKSEEPRPGDSERSVLPSTNV